MTDATSGSRQRESRRHILEFFSDRVPLLITVGCMMLLNWGAALWVLHHAWHEKETAAFQLVTDEVKYSEQKYAALFQDADRTLLGMRARWPGADLMPELARWVPPRRTGGIALIAPDGHILAASPDASTAGWPRLMTRLAASADEMVIGEPVLSRNGHLGFIPVARRLTKPDGAFAGLVMLSMPRDALPELSPAVKAADGFLSVLNDDGVILARTPDVRGTVGMRVAGVAAMPKAATAPLQTGRQISPIDGIDRIWSYHHLDGLPAAVIVGISHEAAFAQWHTLLMFMVATRGAASVLIVVAGYLWYTRQRRARVSRDALSAILLNIGQGVRVQNRDGVVVAENEAGADLRAPDSPDAPSETRRPDGSVVQVSRHDLLDGGMLLIGTDITARHDADARIAFLTSHDKLTGLPNRWLAVSRIQELIARRGTAGRIGALILFDLDGFKDINDTLGHEGGDEVLTDVSGRLRDLVSGHDIIACLGGDEFLLFLNDPDDEAAIMCLARQISRALARPITVRGQQVRLGASMGIALYPRDGGDVTTLFRHADIALGRAKQAGRGTAQSFDPEMMVTFEEQRMMESDLRRALDSDELEMRLQPQFSCETLEVTGFEALTRWRHPTRGDLSPAMFIPIAERSGLINPLGLWAIEHACDAAAGWRTRHRVAVNLSPSQLRGENIQEDIRGILRRAQFPAHLLELEVTESVLLDEDQRTLETLHKLRAMDIRITLDDFGAGYSSLSYLRRFPFDKIKIDKSFVQRGSTDRGTRVILEAMIRMCTDLGFDVVAEGVETEHQLEDLKKLGCREIQGFLLGEPLRPEEVEAFLLSHGRQLSQTKRILSAPR